MWKIAWYQEQYTRIVWIIILFVLRPSLEYSTYTTLVSTMMEDTGPCRWETNHHAQIAGRHCYAQRPRKPEWAGREFPATILVRDSDWDYRKPVHCLSYWLHVNVLSTAINVEIERSWYKAFQCFNFNVNTCQYNKVCERSHRCNAFCRCAVLSLGDRSSQESPRTKGNSLSSRDRRRGRIMWPLKIHMYF